MAALLTWHLLNLHNKVHFDFVKLMFTTDFLVDITVKNKLDLFTNKTLQFVNVELLSQLKR